MKALFLPLLLCLCLIFASCSLPVDEHSALKTTLLAEQEGGIEALGPQLLNIRIERWGKLRFSGLLGMRYQESGLYYMLLDATGVKLLEAQVKRDGSFELRGSQGALKESRLAEYLSMALARIYLQQPTKLPCSRNWLLRFCAGQKELPEGAATWYKKAQLGPFSFWAVKELLSSEIPTRLLYSQPWLGVEISLHRLAVNR